MRKFANIVPVFKKGKRSCAANYRPISLTSICCKVFEHIIHLSISSHLESLNILCNEQHGFRKRRSCETQLTVTIADLAQCIDSGEQIDAILLDFSKAFNRVPHERLCAKLHYYGIRGNLLLWIRQFLTGRHQQVIVDGFSSDTSHVTSGVPQGTVLAPLFFLCYINDLPEAVCSKLKLYADDALIYATIHTDADRAALQDDLHTLTDWANKWQMSFNPTKCEHIKFTNKRNPLPSKYYIDDQLICEVHCIKYLGVNIDHKLTWNNHVNTITNKANSVRAFLQRNLKSCPAKIKYHCYTSLVRPILEYASTAWSPHTQCNITKIEQVQRRSARFITDDYAYTSSVTNMLNSLDLPTLECRRDLSTNVLMYKIVNKLVDIHAPQLIPVSSNTRGHSQRFHHLHARTSTYANSFFPRAIRSWNALPPNAINQPTLALFKQDLLTN